MNSIDLRSDTVTWPTDEMRQAMANAEVGDDVHHDDPTVNRLEALAAKRMGKEAAVFVTSGTQGNLIAILAHCRRGDEMIVGAQAHPFINEAGGAAALGGVHPYPIPIQPDGTLALNDIEGAVRDVNDEHYPSTRLVSIENTNGALGGLPIGAEYMKATRQLCDRYELRLHVDGARIWNAATALNCDVKELVGPADSVTFCLSKGLCAPVGSLLCGSEQFIHQARRFRKMLGGGLRQAGAGIIAIEKMTTRLGEDHANAKYLAEGLSTIPGIGLDLKQVQTNMVFFWLDRPNHIDAQSFASQMETRHDIKLDVTGPRSFRAVTHYWITKERIDIALDAIRSELKAA